MPFIIFLYFTRSNNRESILCYGDVHGNVTAFLFDRTDPASLFEPAARQSDSNENGLFVNRIQNTLMMMSFIVNMSMILSASSII